MEPPVYSNALQDNMHENDALWRSPTSYILKLEHSFTDLQKQKQEILQTPSKHYFPW